MRVPVSWLGEYVDIAGYSIEELDAALVRQGLEVEAIHRSQVSGPVVVGEVMKIEELTGFKKSIRHCQVNVGSFNVDGQFRDIVCGAQNFSVGDWVVVALPGAVLPQGFTISSRQTYGRLSDGMICSARELGLGEDHSGILVLNRTAVGEDIQPGSDAITLLSLNETVIELAITPDRGYCLSMRGVAREVAHAVNRLAKTDYTDPGLRATPQATEQPPYPVRIANPEQCDRFVGRVVQGIDPATPTPLWMVARLIRAGMRPISFIVDVTNYLMLELGQPMHAYDLASLNGTLVVRLAQEGEKLRTLDGVERELHPQDVLIADDTGPIGLAGVMGGQTTEVSSETTDVLIECAHWTPVSEARTARRHKLPSEAAKRFERGVDPAMAPVAAQRAVDLLTSLAGGSADERVLDIDTRGPMPTIVLDAALPSRIVGVEYSSSTVERDLQEIGCLVTPNGTNLAVTPPTWRPDLENPIDLVEEVARLEGYDDIPAVLPTGQASPGLSVTDRRDRAIAGALAEDGFTEVLSYPFTAPNTPETFKLPADDLRRRTIRLANPLSDAEPELRTWILPGLLNTVRRNLSRGQKDIALFEVGLVYYANPEAPPAPRLSVSRRPSDAELAQLFAAVPDQPRHIAAVLVGNIERVGWWGPGRPANWTDAISAAQLVAKTAGVDVKIQRAHMAGWHPGRCAALHLSNDEATVIGYAGELHPAVLTALGLPKRSCALELDLSILPLPQLTIAPKLANFPPVLVDVALVVDAGIPAAAVTAALRAGAGELLENIELFDVFIGEQIGQGRKSLAYALSFRAADRTLTAAEANTARDAAVAEASQQLGAILRS